MQGQRIRAVSLPVIVGLVSVVATLWMWNALRHQERAETEHIVQLATYSIRADMIADMSIRVRGMLEMARLWQIWEHPRKDEFSTRATLYISHVPGCIAIAWLDADYHPNWFVPVDGDVYVRQLLVQGADSLKEVESRTQDRGAMVGHAIELSPGTLVLPVWVPVFTGDKMDGFLVAVFRVAPLLDDILSDHADLGYEVVVSDAGKPIYRLSAAIPENQWAQEARVELAGNQWVVRIWPSSKAIPAKVPLSRVVLIAGLIVACQLSLTAYLAQRARIWAKHVDEANKELRDENKQRRQAEESLHRLSGRLLNLQDQERRRIARELHDGSAQTLYGLTIKLNVLSHSLGDGHAEAQETLFESMELADQCVRDIRTLAYLLHPPSLDELGLGPALRSLAAGFTERSGVEAAVKLPDDIGRLPRDVETALFRIVQEGLSNIHRHSGSKIARICITRDSRDIVVLIADEGRGFPPGVIEEDCPMGVGIAGMRERVRQLGGKLDIRSSSSGTEVVATLPLRSDFQVHSELAAA